MAKEIEITINEDGTFTVEGFNLTSTEKITSLAKFVIEKLGTVTKVEHKIHTLISEKAKLKT